jgi:hypothetical protein
METGPVFETFFFFQKSKSNCSGQNSADFYLTHTRQERLDWVKKKDHK